MLFSDDMAGGVLRDRSYLRDQYGSQDNLQVRIRTHATYSEPKIDFVNWVLDHLDWAGRETVVDAGCGSGNFLAETEKRANRVIAGDLFLGMLRILPPSPHHRLNFDARHLPLRRNTADVILANHMLFYIPDRPGALAEFARVLRPDGNLLATTNSIDSMAELIRLRKRVINRLAGVDLDTPREISQDVTPFSLENGGHQLESHFPLVARYDLPAALLFPQPQPLIDFMASMRESFFEHLPADLAWEEILRVLEEEVEHHFRGHDCYRVNKLTGLFVARQST